MHDELRAFTEWVGEGRKLTQTGKLTLSDARTLVALLKTGDEIDPKIGDRVFRTKSSTELPGLNLIVEWAKATGLVKVVKGRLLPVKKAAPLLNDPKRLWEASFAALGKMSQTLFPKNYWYSSLVGEEFALIWPALQRSLYGGPVPVSNLRELAWQIASPYYEMRDPEAQRRMADQDIDLLLTVLARLGVVELTEETAALTPAAVHAVQRALGEAAPGEPLYQIRVTLRESADPVIWRRLRVSPAIALARLHDILVTAMGWENSHLHLFTVGGVLYGQASPEWELDVRDEKKTRLQEVLAQAGAAMEYEYDLGDSWRHDIVLEEILTAEEGVRYPMLVDGAGACPPEDVGGIGGYEHFRRALADPGHDEHDEYVHWAGLNSAQEFDPARFALEATRRALTSAG
ncbi:plasmid pRiA4b ORF-3 family protein [Nonomuraea wenchangensis]|uniref:PRiA4b ORF-3-like protein n=1 Tax=Nonomuraea wenchangensis TaxID=568860 RepID=A0A1I0CGK7_9ACTN|nr:plasmid pRiA4b ORF-3 family protein [Nonomuraea wenchangensis]SET18278.1 pRiA4b ORF-3-like protein [Nonomuraea wenchangensis]